MLMKYFSHIFFAPYKCISKELVFTAILLSDKYQLVKNKKMLNSFI